MRRESATKVTTLAVRTKAGQFERTRAQDAMLRYAAGWAVHTPGKTMKPVSRWAVLALLMSAPLAAQNVSAVKPMVAPNVGAVAIDYKQQWEKEREKNQQLRQDNARLQSQLAEWTRKGGSLVHAYCETPTMSVNSVGARSDCAANGYGCEPVSGLCRTVVRSSDQCAPGFLMDVDHCVPQPR